MLPDFGSNGNLPPGIHMATLAEVSTRFGAAVGTRSCQIELLRLVVESAKAYPALKRILT